MVSNSPYVSPSSELSDPSKPDGSDSSLLRRVVKVALLLLTLVFVGTGAAHVIQNFVWMASRAKRAELPQNVDSIRPAQLVYESVYGEFVPCSSEATAMSNIEQFGGKGQHPFNPSEHPCWRALGWAPDGLIRGEYWVEVTDGGRDFRVNGISDLDEDGEYARFEATRESAATLVTDNALY